MVDIIYEEEPVKQVQDFEYLSAKQIQEGGFGKPEEFPIVDPNSYSSVTQTSQPPTKPPLERKHALNEGFRKSVV